MSAEHTFSMSGCHNNKSFVRVSLCYERSSSIPRQFGVFSNLWDFWWQHLAFVKCAIVVSICDGCTDDDTRHMNSSYRRIDCPDAYNFGWLAGCLSAVAFNDLAARVWPEWCVPLNSWWIKPAEWSSRETFDSTRILFCQSKMLRGSTSPWKLYKRLIGDTSVC